MNYQFLFDYILKWFNFETWYKRSTYIEKINKSIWNNTIKVLSGIRRVGKSYILKQIIKDLLDTGVNLNNIFYIHLEDERLLNIDVNTLREIFEYYKTNFYKNWVMYVFLDEIQNITYWEKFVRSLQETYSQNIQIFITGSNSNLLSQELSTVLTWRFIEFNIYPFSFQEFLDIKQIKLDKIDPIKYELFNEYLIYGWLPEIIRIQDNEIKKNYLKSLVESIIFKDIVQRYNIKKTQFLESLLIYIYNTTCSNLSINSIVKYLKQEFKTLDYETVNSYIDNISNTFLLNKLSSLWDKTKHILKWKNKFYAIDTGIRNVYSGNYDLEKIIENFVFIELKRRWYELNCIESLDFEIDFFAQSWLDKKLFQVSYTIKDPQTYERELKWFLKTKDQYEKILLTLDKTNTQDKWIKIINLVDWCLE